MRILRVECQPESGRAMTSTRKSTPTSRSKPNASSRRAWRRTRHAGGASPLRQRDRGARAVLRTRTRAVAGSPDPGYALRSAQHAARAGGCARRRRLARRRHRRHDGHAHRPRRRLLQATAALSGARATFESSSRSPRPADHASREPGARRFICLMERQVRLGHRRIAGAGFARSAYG